ncbi:MAG: nitrilase-related carbon-nitrogen hydrolase [Patescibacteria group bacterium]
MILPVLSAVLGILAFLPFNYFWPAGFIFPAPLFIFFIRKNNIWRLIGGVVIFRLIMMSGAVYFAMEPIVWGSSILIFMILPFSVFLLKRILAAAPEIKTESLKLTILFFLPLIWTFSDHIQARYTLLPNYIMTAGNSLGSSPFLGLGALGLAGLTFFASLISALAAAIFVINIKKIKFGAIAAILLLLSGGLIISRFELQKNSRHYAALENSLKIAAVSANEKFDALTLDDLESELSTKGKIDLLILPENIFKNSTDIGFYQNLAKKLNINLIASLDIVRQEKKYNSSLLIDNHGEIIGFHDKSRLTFMGEYWPFKNWRPVYLDWLKKFDLNIGNYVVFNPDNPYRRGEKNLLTIRGQTDSINFASLICLEIHYPADLKKYKKMGAKFFINHTSNRWADIGLKHLLYLTLNLRKIESVWLKTPVVFAGIKDFAGFIAPDGATSLIDFENESKNYGLFIGEMRY